MVFKPCWLGRVTSFGGFTIKPEVVLLKLCLRKKKPFVLDKFHFKASRHQVFRVYPCSFFPVEGGCFFSRCDVRARLWQRFDYQIIASIDRFMSHDVILEELGQTADGQRTKD